MSNRLCGLVAACCFTAVGAAANLAAETIPAGTQLEIRIQQPISSYSTPAGTKITGVLISPVDERGRILIPLGTTVHGSVIAVRKVGLGVTHETAEIGLSFNELVLLDHKSIPIQVRMTGRRKRTREHQQEGAHPGNPLHIHLSNRTSGIVERQYRPDQRCLYPCRLSRDADLATGFLVKIGERHRRRHSGGSGNNLRDHRSSTRWTIAPGPRHHGPFVHLLSLPESNPHADLTFALPFPIISINAAHLSSPANAYGHANPRRSAVHARSLKRSPLVHTPPRVPRRFRLSDSDIPVPGGFHVPSFQEF